MNSSLLRTIPPKSLIFNDYYFHDLCSSEVSVASFICSFLFVIVCAIVVSVLNNKFALIQSRTFLPASFCIILFSYTPKLFRISGDYIAIILFILLILILLSSYHDYRSAAFNTFKCGFLIGIISIFSPNIILYYPVVWIGLIYLRALNIKSFIASIVGYLVFLLLLLSCYFFAGRISFVETYMHSIAITKFPLIQFNLIEWISFACFLCVFIIIICSDFIFRCDSKMRMRTNLAILNIIIGYALLISLLVNINNSHLHKYIILVCSSLILGHFFALAKQKLTTIFFYIVFIAIILTACANIIYL